MKQREDFAAFPTRALYKVVPGDVVASNMAITSIEDLEEDGFYTIRQDSVLRRLAGEAISLPFT